MEVHLERSKPAAQVSGWQQQQTDPETHACAASRAGSVEDEGENGEREQMQDAELFF